MRKICNVMSIVTSTYQLWCSVTAMRYVDIQPNNVNCRLMVSVGWMVFIRISNL